MDFPDNALTNFYVLHDFTDIAYAVCVLTSLASDGTKASTSPSFSQAPGPSVARLQKVEQEIRRNSILVSSDPTKQELFTFFRKADLQRDGKSIFNRLVAVLRSNVCNISEKKAAKAADMLHPDNSKLHRLFMLALTPSIRSVIVSHNGLLSCGTASFIAQSRKIETPEAWCTETSEEKLFRLLDMNAQLVASGHLLLSFRQRRSLYLSQSAVRDQNPEVKVPASDEGLGGRSDHLLVLAPSGRLAKPVSGQASTLAQPQEGRQLRNTERHRMHGLLHAESTKREIWEAMVRAWLVNQGIELQAADQDMWVDVQLPMRTLPQSSGQVESPLATYSDPPITWRSFRWPRALCFEVREIQPPAQTTPTEETGMEDPLAFAEDWFLGADARAQVLEERRLSALRMKELGNPHTEPDTILQNPLFASSPAFHRHAMGDLPMSHHIYPTPPDGLVSQVTPGMSSMDGVVATPADQNQPVPETSHTRDDEEMKDVADAEDNLVVGTGQYDEDLFGDMPVETFGPSGIADEPNWDFFDAPDLDLVTDPSERVGPGDSKGSETLNVDQSDIPVPSPSDQGMGDRSLILDGRQAVGQEGHEKDHASAYFPPKSNIASPKSQADDTHDEEPKMDVLEFSMPEQRQHPLTASEIKRAVAASSLFSGYFATDTTKSLTDSEHQIRVTSLANVMDIETEPQLSDDKYSANGRFWFGDENDNAKKAPKPNANCQIPMIGLHPFDSNSDMAGQKAEELGDKMVLDVTQSEWLSSTEESDFDSSDFFSNENEPQTPSPDESREWTKYAPASRENPETDGQQLDQQQVRADFDQLLEYLRIDDFHANQLVYERPKSEPIMASTKGVNDIMIAQILVDQLTQSSLQHTMFSMSDGEDVPLVDYDVSKELGEVYGTTEQVNLHQLTRISCADNNETERISKLNDTAIRVYREGKPLTALSTILPFWDALGLQPAGGRKNITALCIHPHGSNVRDGCRAFIQRLGETYENCNLGSHATGTIEGTTNGGLVAWSNSDVSLSDLPQTCERVGTALSRLTDTADNIMIYIILPTPSEPQILRTCEGFMALRSAYVKTCGEKQPNEPAMQLVPMSFVALPETLAIPSQNEYFALAIEVYNRCPPAGVSDKIACCGSAIIVAERVSKQLDFDLTPSVHSPFEKNGRALHLAYSQSRDNRWITAAWTDKLGHTALTMSYCIRQQGSRVSRPVAEVIKDLWDISVDLMQKSRTKWRLIVAREGRLTPTEANNWTVLANQSVATAPTAQHTLVLLAVNGEPSLSLRLSPATIKQVQSGATQQPSGLYGTPVSTPQASSTSPDQTAMATPTPGGTALNAPTPPDHSFDPNAEADLCLSDPVEATWSVTLSHGMSQGDSMFEARPALASGYLLKRRGTTDADNVVALEVNIVHALAPSPAERQDLLKEILSQYKDLVTLARTRGMIDPFNCVLPWHIATAIKGQQTLSLIM